MEIHNFQLMKKQIQNPSPYGLTKLFCKNNLAIYHLLVKNGKLFLLDISTPWVLMTSEIGDNPDKPDNIMPL